MADPLATWIVQFEANGFKTVEAASEHVLGQLRQADALTRTFADNSVKAGTAAGKAYEGLGSQVRSLGRDFGITLGALGVLRAGLAGTGDLERLSYLMTQVARDFMSVFLPAIRAVQSALQDILGWFRSLNGEQQALISKMILVTVAIKAMNAAFAASPIGGFLAAFSVLAALSGTIGAALAPLKFIFDFFANSGIGAFILDVILLTSALYILGYTGELAFNKIALSAGTATGAVGVLTGAMAALSAAFGPGLLIVSAIALVLAGINAFTKKPAERQQLGGQAGGPEDLEQTWFRLQRVAAGQDIAVAQLEQLRQIAENTGRPFQARTFGLNLI